jgi:thymidylate synthase
MKNYQDLMKHVLTVGQREPNRTGIDTITTPGEMLRYDLRDGFPATTTKKLAFDSVKGEYISFLNGATSAAEFRANGCKVWDQNANENAAWLANPNRKGVDDLGPVYGSQWRNWAGQPQILTEAPFLPDHLMPIFDFVWEGKTGIVAQQRIDQLANALNDIRNNSQSRRIIVTAWNPAVIDKIALPACHMSFQFLPRSDGTLHMTMLMRSIH